MGQITLTQSVRNRFACTYEDKLPFADSMRYYLHSYDKLVIILRIQDRTDGLALLVICRFIDLMARINLCEGLEA
jgi:hypothetical protein